MNVKRSRDQVPESLAGLRILCARRRKVEGWLGASSGEGVWHGIRAWTTWHGSHKRGLATRSPVEQRVSSPMLATRSPVEQRVSSPMLATTDGARRGRGLLVTGIVYV